MKRWVKSQCYPFLRKQLRYLWPEVMLIIWVTNVVDGLFNGKDLMETTSLKVSLFLNNTPHSTVKYMCIY